MYEPCPPMCSSGQSARESRIRPCLVARGVRGAEMRFWATVPIPDFGGELRAEGGARAGSSAYARVSACKLCVHPPPDAAPGLARGPAMIPDLGHAAHGRPRVREFPRAGSRLEAVSCQPPSFAAGYGPQARLREHFLRDGPCMRPLSCQGVVLGGRIAPGHWLRGGIWAPRTTSEAFPAEYAVHVRAILPGTCA